MEDSLETYEGDPYWGSKEEEMDAEAIIVNEEQKRASKLCANCLERQWTQLINGSHLCLMCAERYPEGMPF